MSEIENWGANYENESMKGYVLYAIKEIEQYEPKLKLTDAQKDILLKALSLATDDMTAEQAYSYYCNN